MSFLRCNPCVFVVKKNYVIVVLTNGNGICRLKIGGKTIYEDNSGVLYSNKDYHKFTLPQKLLDDSKSYGVYFRKTIERKSYSSTFEEEAFENFRFFPIGEKEELKVFHYADVHGNFSEALKCCNCLEKIDLYIINGDINEVNDKEDYYSSYRFLSELTAGNKPVVFTRGNHDTRGRLAENFNDYYPSVNNKNYYTFDVGIISGVVLDCGEDKIDSHKDYNGVNVFSEYRKKQTEFIKRIRLDSNKVKIAVSHINPAQTTDNGVSAFIIEQKVYAKWIDCLEKQDIDFMISGHIHTDYILKRDDGENLINHSFPIIVGSRYKDGIIGGTLLCISKKKITARFIYSDGSRSKEMTIK